MRRDAIKHLAQLPVCHDKKVAAAVFAEASRHAGDGSFNPAEVADAALAAGSAKRARVSVERDAFGDDPNAFWSLGCVDEPVPDFSHDADRRLSAIHFKFSVGCVATPTRNHPAAPVKLAGGVNALAVA